MPDYGNLNLNFPGGGGGGGGGGFMNISYMKKQTTPSVVYTQLPMITMHMGESSSGSYYPYPNYSNSDTQKHHPPSHLSHNFHDSFNGYQNYGAGGGFSGDSYPPAPAVVAYSKLPPPPPSPPRSSTWDFLNPFETFEKYYPAYTPSHDSREVREEEGIPDLEDEGDVVAVKEVDGDQKLPDSRSYAMPVASEEDVGVVNDVDLRHVVYKNSVDVEERSQDQGIAKPRGGLKGDIEVVKQIQVQFDRASDSGTELAEFLEVGKLPFKWKPSSRHGKYSIFTRRWYKDLIFYVSF